MLKIELNIKTKGTKHTGHCLTFLILAWTDCLRACMRRLRLVCTSTTTRALALLILNLQSSLIRTFKSSSQPLLTIVADSSQHRLLQLLVFRFKCACFSNRSHWWKPDYSRFKLAQKAPMSYRACFLGPLSHVAIPRAWFESSFFHKYYFHLT